MSDETAVGAESAVTEVEVPKNNAEVSEGAEAPKSGDTEPQANANEGEQEHKRLGGWQRKIQKLERELAAERAAKAQPVVESKPEPFTYDKPEPKPEDFDLGDGTYDVAKYAAAVARHELARDKAEADHKRAQEQKAEKEKAEKENQSKSIKAWRERNAEAIGKYEDFDEALKYGPPITVAMNEAIMDSEVGGELAYYFATNQDEVNRIAALSPWNQVKEIAKLEAKFAPQESEAEEKDEKPEPPVSKAPKPPTPVSKPSPAAKPVDVMDPKTTWDQWKKAREAQLKRK